MKSLLVIAGVLAIFSTGHADGLFSSNGTSTNSDGTISFSVPRVRLDNNLYTVIATSQNGDVLCASVGLTLSDVADLDAPYTRQVLRANVSNGNISLTVSSSMIATLRCKN